jgi:hypothetical protein
MTTVVEAMERIEEVGMSSGPLTAIEVQDIQIMAECVRVTLTGGIQKVISLEDFRTIFNSMLGTSEETKLDGFNLPANVLYFAKSGSELQVSCYYPSRVAQIRYNSYTKDIIMPNLIISHSLEKQSDRTWKVKRSRYFCTDYSVGKLPKTFINNVDHANHIFLMPMSNTYAEANMCFGGNSMPHVFAENNLRGLDWYYQYMFESPFNDDLGIIAVGHSMTPSSWYSFLETLAKENKPFPYEKLLGYKPG